MRANRGINRHALQRPNVRGLGPAHFQRCTLHQNAGMTFKKDINSSEMRGRFLPPDGDTIHKVPNAVGAALKHHALTGQQQQILARGHITKNTGQNPDKRATIGNVPYAKDALKRGDARGDGQ